MEQGQARKDGMSRHSVQLMLVSTVQTYKACDNTSVLCFGTHWCHQGVYTAVSECAAVDHSATQQNCLCSATTSRTSISRVPLTVRGILTVSFVSAPEPEGSAPAGVASRRERLLTVPVEAASGGWPPSCVALKRKGEPEASAKVRVCISCSMHTKTHAAVRTSAVRMTVTTDSFDTQHIQSQQGQMQPSHRNCRC